MKKLIIFFISLLFISNISYADFKKIKKKATVTNVEIIFPIQRSKKNWCRFCDFKIYVTK